MKTIRKVEIVPVQVVFCPEPELMEQNKVYVSKEFETSVHLCLCGCKELVVTPFKPSLDMWKLIENGDKVSFTPSILNRGFDCQSHYIITNNVANFV